MSSNGADGGIASRRFKDLLNSLQDQHDQEVEDLRREVERLRAKVPGAAALHALGKASVAFNGENEVHQAPQCNSYANADSEIDASSIVLECRSKREHLRLKSVWLERARTVSTADGDECAEDYEEGVPLAIDGEPEEFGMKLDMGKNGLAYTVINPNSQWRTYWAFTGLGMVCFDLVHVPLQAFNLPSNFFLTVMDWTTLLFWTMDMLASCTCGYFDNGQAVMDLRQIIPHYLKGWFILDLLVVGPDWVQKALANDVSDAGGVGRLLRGARAIRILRLLRIMKLQRIISKLYDMIDNEYTFLLAELLKMMLCILVLNHVIACGWFLVGSIATSLDLPSWLTWSERENFLNLEIGYQYTTCLHWTLTQFTPASMDVVARNILERVYSIMVLLFAMVAFSSIVGTITTSMTIIRQMKEDASKQFWKLRRFLKQRKISTDLTQRMLRFLEYQISKQERTIQVSSVQLLNRISEQLSRELAHEMHWPFLEGHVFFQFLSRSMQGVAFRISHSALRGLQVARGDVLFTVWEEAAMAFVIKSGDLTYIFRNGQELDPPLTQKEWLAEAVLWTNWRYRGRCVANAPSEILGLDSKRFAEAMCNHPKSLVVARRYGQRFLTFLNSGVPEQWMDVVRDEDFYRTAVHDDTESEDLGRSMQDSESEDLQSPAKSRGGG